MAKPKVWAVLGLLILALLAIARSTVQAGCISTVSLGRNDEITCTNPADTGRLRTGEGDDLVTIQAGVELYSPDSTLVTGPGSDVVNQYGSVLSGLRAVGLGDGSDQLHNYGYIEGGDDGAGCEPRLGDMCRIYNHPSGIIHANNEGVDMLGDGGSGLVYNEGRISSAYEEAIHLRHGIYYEVVNLGVINGPDAAIEVFNARARVVNTGTISAIGDSEYGINLDYYDDTVINTGAITNQSDPAIGAGAGNDVIEHYGTITTYNDIWNMAAIEADDGDDQIVIGGDVSELGSGHAAIDAGHGSDLVVIQGGIITGAIDGDHEAGGRAEDFDTLVFAFGGSRAEIEAFRAAVAGQRPRSGSAAWQGNTYTWQGFEAVYVIPGFALLEPFRNYDGWHCPSGPPPRINALNAIPQDDGSTILLQWQDIGDPCTGVLSYTVTVWNDGGQQDWTFNRAALLCSEGACWAAVALPPGSSKIKWYVRAANARGAGPTVLTR